MSFLFDRLTLRLQFLLQLADILVIEVATFYRFVGNTFASRSFKAGSEKVSEEQERKKEQSTTQPDCNVANYYRTANHRALISLRTLSPLVLLLLHLLFAKEGAPSCIMASTGGHNADPHPHTHVPFLRSLHRSITSQTLVIWCERCTHPRYTPAHPSMDGHLEIWIN